jgi:hypothetical protein
MSFHRWLRGATTRLNLEALEDRLTPSFSPATSFPVGPNPQAVVTADFNNDGHLDLATANAAGNTVSVLLGDGRGGFGAANHFAAGPGPRSMAVGDFNNDGNPDLVTVSDQVAGASTMLGNGDGTFRAPRNHFTWGGPQAVAVGDFNADGSMDIVVSEFDDQDGFSKVQVLLGNGQDGFTAANPYTLDFYLASGLAVSDLNGDGMLDVAVVVPSDWTGIGYAVLGKGDGTFGPAYFGGQEFVTGLDSRAVAVGDFTGDGIPDLVVAGQTVDVLRGHGDGWFDDPITHSANGNMHTGVVVADFNGDGKLDAVTSDADAGTVSLMLGNGDGTLLYAGAFAAGSSPTAVAVGDFNDDGRPEVAAANGGSNTVSVLLNDGAWPPLPLSLRIHDVTVVEGNSGTVAAVFPVTLSAASDRDVTVWYATADGTATAGSDHEARSGQLTIPAGQTSATIVVPVYGDRIAEVDETFSVRLTDPTNAVIGYGTGTATIVDDEPRIFAGGAQVIEGNSGTSSALFTVNLSAAYDQPITVAYATADGTATAGSDYQAASGTLIIPAGQTTGTITVLVNGDRLGEANETFFINLSGATSAFIVDGQGVGTIVDDEPRISISDVTRYEGRKNHTTLFTFTVTLSAAYDQPVTVSFRTADGTATTSDNDYVARTGTLTFVPGETTKTITIEVKGDTRREADETFFLDLFDNSSNSWFSRNRGIGTILNDD